MGRCSRRLCFEAESGTLTGVRPSPGRSGVERRMTLADPEVSVRALLRPGTAALRRIVQKDFPGGWKLF